MTLGGLGTITECVGTTGTWTRGGITNVGESVTGVCALWVAWVWGKTEMDEGWEGY